MVHQRVWEPIHCPCQSNRIMPRSSRYRLYHHKTQKQQFQRLCGASRFVTNELLSERVERHKQFKEGRAGKRERPGLISAGDSRG